MIRFLPRLKDFIDDNENLIKSNSQSHVGLIVPKIVYEYGKFDFKSLGVLLPTGLKIRKEMVDSYKSTRKNPKLNKTLINNNELKELKQFILSLGVNDIGYAEVERAMVFKDKAILYNNAIVITMEMKKEFINTAPSLTAQKEIMRTYYELGYAVNKIASYLRSKGFNAQAGPALGGDVNYVWLAEKAGLGAVGKHGCLITPDFGPSLRIAAIYTDIENLPNVTNNIHLWIKDFCKQCNRCVKQCPVQAIYSDTKVFTDKSEEHIDYKKCVIPFSRNNGCTICVKECTFYKSDYYKIKEKFHGYL